MELHPAIGDTRGLPEHHRLLLGGDDFDPLQPTERPEPEQPYPAFVASRPRRPSERRILALTSIGEVPDLERLAGLAEAWFGLPVRVDEGAAAPASGGRLFRGHRQLLTRDALAHLAEGQRDEAFASVAITAVDLYPGDGWPHVRGQAWPWRGVAVTSTARCGEGATGRRGAARGLVHEFGHLLGMAHCTWFRCAMNGLGDDERPLRLCPVCLRKLTWSVGLDPVARYERVAVALRGLALDPEADWAEARARLLVAV